MYIVTESKTENFKFTEWQIGNKANDLEIKGDYFTEKTTKAIFAKRLFVVFSSKGYLQRLRDLGFKTFSNVIDESYDDIVNGAERIQAIADTVQQIVDLPQDQFLAACEPRCKYNQQHMAHLARTAADRWLPQFYQYVRTP